jgi:hypothetical protein
MTGPWRCVGADPTAAPAGDGGPNYYANAAVTIAGTPNDTALSGLQATVCSALNIPLPSTTDPHGLVPCTAPLVPTFALTDPNRIVVPIPPPPAPNLFIAFENQDPTKALPGALWFNRVPDATLVSKTPILVVDLPHAQTVAANLGVTLDPTLGLVLLNVFDCDGNPAAGVTARLDCGNPAASNVPFTIQDGIPNDVPTVQGGPQTTDGSGLFGFGNVMPFIACSAFLSVPALNNLDLGRATLIARPSWATGLDFRP